MSEVMSVGDCIGSVATVTWKGTAYTLSAPCPESLAKLELWIAGDILASAKETAAIDPPGLAEARKNVAARHHRVGAPYWEAVMSTPIGATLQLWALVGTSHPEFTFDDAEAMRHDEPDQVDLALLLAAPDFFTGQGKRMRLPPDRLTAGRQQVVEQVAAELAKRAK